MRQRIRVLALVMAVAAVVGKATAESRAVTAAGLDLATATFVDLTHAYDETTVYWPTDTKGFRLEVMSHGPTAAGFFYAANAFCTAEHGGTHLDAPIHFHDGGVTADALPLDRLIAPAVVIDVAARAAVDPDYRLTVADVEAFERDHGRIARGEIVLLRTGWSARWPDRKRYLGDDTPGDATNLRFPAYGAEAAALLVGERGVAALGLDTASLDHGPSRDFPVHRVAGAANVPGFENLTNLERLPPRGAWLIALPMRIGGGSGAPLRAVAALPAPR